MSGSLNVNNQLLCLIAFTGGLRRKKIFGLEWPDIDFDRNVITVRQASIYVRRQDIKTKIRPKTKESARQLSMPQKVMDLLKQHKAIQEAVASNLGNLRKKNNRIFTTATGKAANPHSVTS
jgi:integrase